MPSKFLAYFQKRRRTALAVYAVFLLALAALCVWLFLDFSTVTQCTVFLLFCFLAFAFFTVRKRAHLAGLFAPVCEGVVLEKEEHYEAAVRTGIRGSRIHYTAGKMAIGMGRGGLVRTLAVDFDGCIREVRMPTPTHADLYLVGDRILCHPCFAVPILLSDREPPHRGCPLCGTICPTSEGAYCRTCEMPLTAEERG